MWPRMPSMRRNSCENQKGSSDCSTQMEVSGGSVLDCKIWSSNEDSLGLVLRRQMQEPINAKQATRFVNQFVTSNTGLSRGSKTRRSAVGTTSPKAVDQLEVVPRRTTAGHRAPTHSPADGQQRWIPPSTSGALASPSYPEPRTYRGPRASSGGSKPRREHQTCGSMAVRGRGTCLP